MASFGDDFAAAGAATLYDGRLADQSVSILTLPGADEDVVSGLAAQVERAGGTVAGDVRRPAGARRRRREVPGRHPGQPADDHARRRRGRARTPRRTPGSASCSGSRSRRPTESHRRTRRRSGRAWPAPTCSARPADARRAPLVLVVLGDDVDDAILSGLLAGLAAKADGVVVAGDAASGIDGDLRRAARGAGRRATSPPSTASTSVVGQVTAVLALDPLARRLRRLLRCVGFGRSRPSRVG